MFVNYHLAAERLDMAHGVEVRLPFLDHVLFERLARLPLAVLITPDVEKRLLRDAMRPFLPGSAFRRPKKPFWAPPEATRVSSRLNTLVQDTLRGTTARSLPFFDHQGLVKVLDDLPGLPPGREGSADSLLLAVTSLVILQGPYGIRG